MKKMAFSLSIQYDAKENHLTMKGNELFVWIGHDIQRDERRTIIPKIVQWSQAINLPSHQRKAITYINSGSEPAQFLSLFNDWPSKPHLQSSLALLKQKVDGDGKVTDRGILRWDAGSVKV